MPISFNGTARIHSLLVLPVSHSVSGAQLYLVQSGLTYPVGDSATICSLPRFCVLEDDAICTGITPFKERTTQ